MKKFLLSVSLMAIVFFANAQLYLNELYVRPSDGNQEFFELYNSSLSPENAGCYSVVTYFNDGTDRGIYVVDLPDTVIAGHGFLVGSSTDPYINYQGGTAEADFGWNPDNITRYVYRGGKLIVDNTGAPFNDIFLKSGDGRGNNGLYAVFLFKSSTIVDAFIGAEKVNDNRDPYPDYIVELGMLTHTSAGGSCGNISFDFGTVNSTSTGIIGNVGSVPQAAGTDNGYLRSGNGPCPDNNNWYKASSPADHTPGFPNTIRNQNQGNGQGNTRDSLNVIAACLNTTVSYNVRSTSNTTASVFPVSVSLYSDVNNNGKLDNGDTLVATDANYNVEGQVKFFNKPANQLTYLVVVDAAGVCYDEVVAVACPEPIVLPVNLRSFNARRATRSNVALTWETASEQNNRGFYVQRMIGGGNWENVVFINSLAAGGNSDAPLTYTFNDVNGSKGISQYRLLQVDIDGKTKYSDIRSVRGDAQDSKTIVYPNPSTNGVVNVMFDEASTTRTIVISDINGRAIQQYRNYKDNNLQINNLVSGMYTIMITDMQTGTQTTQKVVVNRH